jgi:hypothetical protein
MSDWGKGDYGRRWVTTPWAQAWFYFVSMGHLFRQDRDRYERAEITRRAAEHD